MGTAMRARPWVRLCTSVLAGGGLAVFAFGLAGGIAQAAPAPAPDYHWCPGDQWNPGWGKAYDWDWNHCHDWQGPAGQIGSTSWGPRAGALGSPAAVGAAAATSTVVGAWGQLMWNETANGWGFWKQRNMDFDLRETR
jgi:hypothetical protein